MMRLAVTATGYSQHLAEENSQRTLCGRNVFEFIGHFDFIDKEIIKCGKCRQRLRVCIVEGCKRKHYGKGYCQKHFQQLKKRGKILKRTRLHPNEFVVESKICRIKIYDTYGVRRQEEAIIDVEDYEKCKKHKWHVGSGGYIATHINRKNIKLEHVIMNHVPNRETVVDHINRNTLDNRKVNLRVCHRNENNLNSRGRKKAASIYKGVYWDKSRALWVAKSHGKHIGRFKNEEDAARAVNKYAKEVEGEFAYLNFPNNGD